MADDLEEVRQRFEADMAEYLAEIDRGAEDARKFATANAEAAAALAHERDEALATAAALGIYADKMGRLHDANGQFVSSAKAAELGLTSFKDELKKAADTEREADDRTRTLGSRLDGLKSKFSELASGVKNFVDKIPGANTKIPLLGNIPGIGGIASNPYGLAAVVGTVQALLPELTGLVSGFAAAGAGAGAFALLAKPAVTSVTTAYTNLNTAVTAYQAAQAKEAMAPSKANATAVRNALTNVNLAGEAIQKLPQSEQNAVDGLERLSTSFHKLSTAFQPEAFKVFADVLKIANELLPHLTPFATSFADALDGVLKKTAGFAGSKGFKDWLAQFQSLVGPSVTAIGEGIGKVAVAIGHLLTTMSAKDVVNSLNIAFTVLAGIVVALTDAVRFSMMQWDALTRAFDTTRAGVKAAGHEIALAFDAARQAATVAAHDIAAHFGEIRHDVANLAHNIASYFDEIRANIHRWASDVTSFVQSNWHLLAAIILGPLGLIQDAISTHLRGIETAFRVAYAAIVAIVRPAIAAITAVLRVFAALLKPLFSTAFGQVEAVFRAAFGSMRSTTSGGTSAIRGVLSWFGGLASMFRGWWNAAANAVSAEIGRLIGFVRTIPGRVNSALGNLPSMLFRAGINAIEGLIRGMGSMVGSAVSQAASWGHDIVNALGSAFGIHFSEPSEAAKMIAAGARIPQGLAKGMAANLGPLLAAAQRVSAAATPGGYGAAGAAAGAGGSTAAGAPSVHVTVPISLGAGTQGYNDPRFLQYIQGAVQEAVLRYTGVNPTNGLSLAGKL